MQTKKILLVDDDRLMLKYLTDLLEREGHEVASAQDGFAIEVPSGVSATRKWGNRTWKHVFAGEDDTRISPS